MAGYLAGVSVAVRQVMPDNIIYRSPIGKITNRNIPLFIFALALVFWALKFVEGSFVTMFGSGLIISWCYLRFYQVHSNGTKGDMADSFAFHTFFPNVLQPPVAVVCNMVFAFLVKIHVCKKPVRKYDMGSASSSISISLPGVETHDTERRRQIALKALSERLNKAEEGGQGEAAGASGAAAWPSLEEDESEQQQAKVAQGGAEVHAPAAAAPPTAVLVDVANEQQPQEATAVSPTTVNTGENLSL